MRELVRSFLFLIFAFYFLFPTVVSAQSQNVSVSPQLVKLDLSVDAPEAEFSYTNNTSQTIELTLSMQDVKELEDRGIPGLLDEIESKNYKYGLSSWASFSNKNLVIAPGETKKVTVFIEKTRLSIGGHYASVLAEIKQVDETKAVKLRAILSSLIFVRTGSEFETEDASLSSLQFFQEFYSFPKTATFRFQNNGNVDLTPYGILVIKDPLNRVVERQTVNEDSLITLPESSRRYTLHIASKKAVLPPGMYKAELTVNYGKEKVKKEYKTAFFSLGSLTVDKIIAIALFGSAGSFLVLKFRRRNNAVK